MESKKSITHHLGYDLFTREVGLTTEMVCPCCGSPMCVEHNVQRINKFTGEAITGEFVDQFTCENSGENWHLQIIALLETIDASPSQRLSQVMREEIQEIILTKKTTKEDGHWR